MLDIHFHWCIIRTFSKEVIICKPKISVLHASLSLCITKNVVFVKTVIKGFKDEKCGFLLVKIDFLAPEKPNKKI